MSQDIPIKIGNFFIKKKDDLISHSSEDESEILKSLKFMEELNLEKDDSCRTALFGWGNLQSDFKPKNQANTIIEVKYIRTTNPPSGRNYNECDIKNSLSQIIEQAACKGIQNAVLVIIDSGRAVGRVWNELEGIFISMFKQNPFNIYLSIVRVQLDLDNKNVSYQVF